MSEVLTVLTYKSVSHIKNDRGTMSWVISQGRARRCSHVVCVRHQQGPYKAEGDEPHKHAFLVGKVSDVVPASATSDRFRVVISEYAVFDGPLIPLVSASPTQYFPSLESIGIDEASLHWEVMPASDEEAAEDGHEDAGDGVGSILMRAKMLVADALRVPVTAVEINIRY